MVVDRATGSVAHRLFRDLVELVPALDVVVFNTTRVVRARLLGTRESGGRAEVMLLKRFGDDRFEAMVHPGRRLKPGRVVHVASSLSVEILEATGRGTRMVRLIGEGNPDDLIEQHGHVPLPPYISRADTADDAERYQTVYARERGSVAAPTAGLHFTASLLDALDRKGVRRADVVLHVGAGTFKPVDADDLDRHVMHEEWYRVPPDTADAINMARKARRHVWAVGTTTLRTLESVVDADAAVHAAEGETRIFIHPPFTVRSADRLVTNFHLPRSTLFMLVSAFAGLELMREAYAVAVRERYRFYSYGDAMVIV